MINLEDVIDIDEQTRKNNEAMNAVIDFITSGTKTSSEEVSKNDRTRKID